MNNKKIVLICVIVVLIIIVAINLKNKPKETPSTTNAISQSEDINTSTEPEEPDEHGTSNYVDYIYYKAKYDAVTATEDELQDALNWLKNNTDNYFSTQKNMELAMYYGELLEMTYKDLGNEYEKIGWQTYKTIKYVYRGAESIEDETTQHNLNELKEMLSNVADIK